MRRIFKRWTNAIGGQKGEARSSWQARRTLFAESGLFDRDWYLNRNVDIRQQGRDPLDHLAEHGAQEWRDPGPDFDSAYYAETNPSFAETGLSPLEHYLRVGRTAGLAPTRPLPPAPQQPMPIQPVVEEGENDGAFRTLVEQSGLFDRGWYLARNTDVLRAGLDPLMHLVTAGAQEWRDPGPDFDSAFYAETNPSFTESDLSPLEHYLRVGREAGLPATRRQMEAEGQFGSLLRESGLFDAEWYLKRYSDVRGAGLDPFEHLIKTGAREGRDPGPNFESALYSELNPSFTETDLSPLEHYLRFGRAAGITPVQAPPYARWLHRFDSLTEDDRARIEADARAFTRPDVLCLYVLRGEAEAASICAAMAEQIGVKPALCLVSGPGDLSEAERALASLPNGAVAILAAGEMRLRAHAAYCFASVLARGTAEAAFSDHDHLDSDGQRTRPVFKPAMAPLFMAQVPYAGPVLGVRLSLASRARIQTALMQALASDPSTAFAALLLEMDHRSVDRIPLSLYALPDREQLGAASRPEVYEVVPGNLRALPPPPLAEPPEVRILIPTRDRQELLEPCISSILNKTKYPRDRYRIIVIDNDSREPESVAYLKTLADTPSCTVVPSPGLFNFSKICNDGAASTDGEILVFLNNDITVIESDWLTSLVAYAAEPDVGAVGAKLLYPDDTIQHGGVVLGVQGVGAHRLVRNSVEECIGLDATREMTAVTGACLAIRRSAFEAVGGFDPVLAVAFNDAHLCMRLFEKGYRNIYIARALLYHHESKSRGYDDSREKLATNRREAIYVRSRHASLFRDDPSYNPNLSLQRIGDLSVPPRHVLPWRRSPTRRKVLLLSHVHGLGHGVACVVGLQAEQFLTRGWDVTVGGPVGDGDRDYPGCRRVKLVTDLQAASYAVTEGYDCVLAHTPPYFSMARYFGARPLFYFYDHGEPPPALFEDWKSRESADWEKRFSAPLAHRVFTISKAIHAEQYRADALVLRNGNNHLAAWTPNWAAKRQALRRKFGFEGHFVILNVCRFHEGERRYKGVDLFATVAADARYVVPDIAGRVIFALAGRGDDEDVAHLRKAGLSVFPNVTDEEMAELYAASDLFMSLSQWEGYNLGIGQALAMGLPVIASDIPAHREFGIPVSNAVPTLCALLGQALSQWDEAAADRRAHLEHWDVPLSQLVDILEEDVAADLAGRWL